MKLKYPTGSIPAWLHKRANQMINRPVDLSEKYIHVTQLLQPAPMLRMQDAHWSELEVSPDDLIPAMLGAAWHKYLEGSMTGGVHEQRIEVPHGDWTIIGTPDWYGSREIVDYKTTRVWSAILEEGGLKREWVEQCNVYRWLVNRATGCDITSLKIHVVYTDWTSTGAMRNSNHPRKRWQVLDVPVWHLDDARNFIDQRLKAIEEVAPFDYCTPEERWERGEHWALMKHGRKSAIKKYDTEDEALHACYDDNGKVINAYYVEHRPGVPVRCNDWCSVKRFCSFGKKLEEADGS
jgi:hypothetical protein